MTGEDATLLPEKGLSKRLHYGALQKNQLRIVANTISQYLLSEELRLVWLGSGEYGNSYYASSKLGLHLQAWNVGVTLDFYEFEEGSGEEIKKNIEAIVSEAEKISEEKAAKLNLVVVPRVEE